MGWVDDGRVMQGGETNRGSETRVFVDSTGY